ncbi:MAG: thiamine pyrophosphate-dependent enzyme [Ferruginibacter sp.]|nr:thiamine pyrophosphate-dependent enzyme [Ferruginibacter sp.]
MLNNDVLLKAYEHMCTARAMAELYETNRQVCKYVHSTSRGHEAIQLATAFHLRDTDFVSPYYRDESMLLGLGFTPYELMLQLLAKGNDIFTSGRSYYSHPNHRGPGKPTIIHQSSATGMQAIPTTGIAQGVQYLEKIAEMRFASDPGLKAEPEEVYAMKPVVLCSIGDAAITEGEVSEAFQFAALHQLPIIYLVQDNNWGISVEASEARTSNAKEFIAGFTGIKSISIDGSNFSESYEAMERVITEVRQTRKPYLVHAAVPLLGHHTSGVRKEFYRSTEDLEIHFKKDPLQLLGKSLRQMGIESSELDSIQEHASRDVLNQFEQAKAAAEPEPQGVEDHVFAPTTILEEKGERAPKGREKVMMVDAALFAIREIMASYPEAVLYGQDVGRRLGGVFREAATLAEQFGDHRVFNTAIQEAYIVGSTVGMCAAGAKPIVEVQFADYIFPGLNQLVTEVSKSCYLTGGKFPVQALIRVPVGAYGGGGPYHSASIESMLCSIKGIKIAYPSNAADMKGLMKAAFLDPNPVVMLEHKGLYWSKVPGTEAARTIEPAEDYIIPLGKGRMALAATQEEVENGNSCCIITYGMGVFWSLNAAGQFPGRVEVIDLRCLFPLDEELVFETVKRHGKCLLVTEEQQSNSFAEALSGRISKTCFRWLDSAVEVIGALDLPAVPMNTRLEEEMLPNAAKVGKRLRELLEN